MAAAADLGDAREAQGFAETAAEGDTRRLREAADEWYRHVLGSGHPELGSARAAILIDREARVQSSIENVRQASAVSEDRERSWQTAKAFERATRQAVDRLARKNARKREERAAGALADRVTIAWTGR
ncbi:hypothetical protein [Sphingomonas sp. DT-204]|uniref:hypothetical protein n=1 Tax=Sphingomonas sp. DT-204 TaxID=3396166 RepID=UPI003F1A12D9